MRKSKKSALMLAVLGLGCCSPVMDNTLIEGALGVVSRAEAADNHPDIYMGHYDSSSVEVYLKWNSAANRYGIFCYSHAGALLNGGDIYDSHNDYGKETLRTARSVAGAINAGQITASSVIAETIHQVANSAVLRNKLSQTESNAKSYTDTIAAGKTDKDLGNITDAGKTVIKDLAKDAMKDAGVDATGNTVIINKPMETKDIHTDGKITTTGDIEAGGNIKGKGDLDIDGKTHLHDNTEIDKELTIHGNEKIDGTLDVGDDSTFEKNIHIKGNQEIDGDSVIHGGQMVDGTLHVKDNAEFEKDVWFVVK